MSWSTVRKFLAAWGGVTIGHVSAGTGATYRTKLLDRWLGQVDVDPWTAPLTIGVILAVSAIHTTAVMLGYHEKDEAARSVRRVVHPRNYFWSGLAAALAAWLIVAAFAGIGVDLSQLSGWVRGGQ